jgi:hypothetical protein
MKVIYKYKLEPLDLQTVTLPKGYEIVSAQMQYNDLFLWALVDKFAKEDEVVEIEILATGSPIPEYVGARKFISTVQMHGGRLVWHIFRRAQ